MSDGSPALPKASASTPEGERLASFLNGLASGFYAVDRAWRLTFFSNFCEQFLGRGRSEVLGRELWDAFPMLRGSEFETRLRLAMADRAAVEFEAPSRARPDKIVRWRVVPTDEGLGVNIDDVTDGRRAERALRENEARLRALADNLPSGMVYQMAMRPDGSERRFIYISEGCERLNGVPAEAVLADPGVLYARIAPEEQARLAAGEAHAIATLTPMDVEVAMIRPDGQRYWSRIISAPRSSEGDLLMWDGLQIDVSERRSAEAARAAAEERGRLAAEAARIGVWDWDLTTRTLRWDERARALFGVSPDALIDDAVFREAIHPDDRAQVGEAVSRALDPSGSGDYHVEYRVNAGEGGERWISATGRSQVEAGRTVRFIGAMIDITERKAAEAQTERLYAEAQRELAERRRAEEHLQLLIHELNHRVKNTLATVQSIALQTLKRSASPEAAQRTFEERLIALSKAHDVLTAQNWEGAHLHDVIHGAVEPFQTTGRRRFTITGPTVRLSPQAALALAMAFHELGTNAVKYGALSAESGEVDIGWSRLPRPQTPELHLVWRERGGPEVTPPQRTGFGSRLIERGLAAELRGAATLDYEATGLICTITAQLTEG